MEDSNEINNISNNKQIIKEESNNNKNINNIIKIFFISCFNKSFSSNIKEFSSENTEYPIETKEIMNQTEKNFEYKIHSIIFDKEKEKELPKKLKLDITLNDDKKFSFKDINIKYENPRFIFQNLEITNEKEIIEYIKKEKNIEDISIKNYYNKLSINELFSIFFDFLDNYNDNNDSNINLDEYKKYLSGNFIYHFNKKNNINFTLIIKLFVLSYYNENIIKFLDIITLYEKDKINIDFDNGIIPTNFYDILKNNNDEKIFTNSIINFAENIENISKRNIFIKEHSKLLYNFIFIYYIMYDIDSIPIDENNSTQIEKVFKSLLNKQNDIVKYLDFIINHFQILAKINDIKIKTDKIYIFKLDKKFDVTNLNFIEKYNKIISLQNKLFIDFSLIIDKCIDNFKNILPSLKEIYITFKKELNDLQNIKIYNKLRKKIHNLGIKLYKEGTLINEELINFLNFDEYYTTDIEIKIKEKDIYILEGINIATKDSPLIKIMQDNKIYTYFNNIQHKYLEIFTKKIKAIKDFCAFFSLLPDNNFNHEATLLLLNWIKNNINSFSIKECPNFKEDINHFFSIMIEYADELLEDLIDYLSNKLGDFCKELYMYILNNNKNIKQKIKEKLIKYFINEININYELLEYFVANLQRKENDILNIFYDKIQDYIIEINDFRLKSKTIKYKIFKLLISHKLDFIDNRNNNFLKETWDKCKDIINYIKNKEIIYEDITNLKNIFLDKNEFIQKYKEILIFINENNDDNMTNILYDEIIQMYNQRKIKIEKLILLSEYYKTFFNIYFTKEKNNLDKSISNLKNTSINNLYLLNNEYEKYKNELDQNLLKLSLYRNSHIFKSIYEFNKEKEKDELNILNESYKNFKEAINIFNINTEEIQNNNYIRFFIELGENSIQNINEEINKIIKECKLNISKEKKEKLLNALFLLIQKNNLKHIISSILSLVALFSNNNNNEINRASSVLSVIEKIEKDDLFINQIKDFRKLLNDIMPPNKIKSIMDFLKNKFNQIDFDNDDFKEKLLPFFIEYDKKADSIKFLKNIIKIENVHGMKDFLKGEEENGISIKDLDELIKTKKFLEKIDGNKTPEEIIKEIIEGIFDETKCGKSLINVLKKLELFQKFLEQIYLGEEDFIQKINKILLNSRYIINKAFDNFQLLIIYQNQKENNIDNNQQNLKEIEINEHDLDILYIRAITANLVENIKNDIEIFKDLYKQSKKILKIINKLYRVFGYPIIEEIFIYCNDKINIFCTYEMKKYTLKELYDYFSNIKTSLKNTYKNILENNKEINLFYGKQLYLIYTYIKNKEYNKIKDLLRNVSNGLIKKFDDKFNFKMNNKDPYDNMIKTIHEYINMQLNYNNQTLEGIFKENQIVNKNYKNKGGIYFYLNEKDIELFILNCFINITEKLPSSNNLLICNKDTSFEEVQCIINKFIYLKNNNLFIIAKCDLLNTHNKRKLINELKDKSLLNDNNNILLIIFSENDSDFHKSILKIEKINSFNLNNFNAKPKIKDFFKNIEIVNSVGCGYGKTTYILENKANIIHFPIGGDLNRKYLEERIDKEISDTSKFEKCILYINISQTKDIEILKEFLFKLLIFKKCDFNHNVKYFGSNVEIKIEIPNDFFDYMHHLKFFELFKEKKINMKKLNLSQNIKIVSTFLSKHENNELIRSNINIETDCETNLNKCEQVIKNYIYKYIKNPNFYQINIFVKILETEFKFFNNCYGLTPKQLLLSGNKIKLRKYIIDSLINVTSHFTVGPYEDLIKVQERTKSYLKSSNENNEVYLEDYKILQIKNITYDEIKPTLIAFNKDGNSITIITTSDENSKEYKYLQKLYLSQNIEYQKNNKHALNAKNLLYLANKYKSMQNNNNLIIDNNKTINKRQSNNNIIIENDNKKEDSIIDIKNNNNISRLNSIIEREISIELSEMNDKEENNIDIIDDFINGDDNNDKEKVNIPKLKVIKDWTDKEILEQLLSFLNVNGLSEDQIKNIIGNYIYTQDNFIKVILILMRLRSKVPVIMMGETGCGKTALIRMAYNLINKNKNKNSMKIINIHSGTNDKDIIDFIEKIKEEIKEEDKALIQEKKTEYDNMKEEDKRQYEKNIPREEQYKIIEQEIKSRKIWIFFDEINTCNSMGLLSEIFCQNTIRGKPIENRFVFIGACNPYRILSKENLIDAVLYHKNSVKKKLVYSVNPLPHSLLNFVFNFGELKKEDEKKYIESMIREPTRALFNLENNNNLINNDEENYEKLMKTQIELISLCQIYMKEKNDVSIVSLREVNRFNIFFKFFINYIQQRNKYEFEQRNEKFKEINDFYLNKDSYEIYLCAINLSIYICYYLRLPNKEMREELEQRINDKNLFNNDFLKLPKIELEYLINNLKIENGIAKNDILKENLFASFFCVVNKIPLIICGKPGRGKTLSIKILEDSLKGKEFSDSFICKLYDELVIEKIQGSTSITSKIITDKFTVARKKQKRNENKLVLVVMDEMGLAELSENNPLKVTHYELEKEEDKVSFVGISNWALDASKMNRVIYIIGQEPNEDSLKETAKEIIRSYEIEKKKNYYEKYKIMFDNLSLAYFNYIKKRKINNDKYSFFHGSRDFYSLIKTTMDDIIKKNNNIDKYDLNQICLRNIERNFGGLEDSIKDFKQELKKLDNDIMKYDNKDSSYDIMSCIRKNLCSDNCRYLLLIFENNVTRDILNYIIDDIFKYEIEEEKIDKNEIILNEENEIEEEINNNNNKIRKNEKKYLIGSKFKSDKNDILYSDDMLQQVKFYMEKNIILILQDLEIIYPALYELFNQNIKEFEKKKYTHLGGLSNQIYLNDNFKTIVYINKENIPEEDPPFLNRFEKHLITITNILEEKYIKLADEIYNVLSEIISFNLDILNKNIKFIDKDEVRGLVYISLKNKKKTEGEIIEFVLGKIVPTFTEDMIVYIQKFDFRNKYNLYYELIKKIYFENYKYNLFDYLKNIKYNISIVYTFSSINDKLFENEIKENKDFKKSIFEIILYPINSINILEEKLLNFLTEPNKNICVIKLRKEELDKIENVINLIELKKTNKQFIILIHLSRTNSKVNNKKQKQNEFKVNSKCISYLSPIYQIFIDNINNQNLFFNEFLEFTNEDIIFKMFPLSQLYIKFENCFRYFSYKIIGTNEIDSKKYISDIISEIKENEKLKNILKKSIQSLTKNDENYLYSIFKEGKIKENDIDFLESLKKYLDEKIEEYIRKLIYLFDKNQIFTSFISNKKIYNTEIIKKYLNNFINNINNENLNTIDLDGINIHNKKEQDIFYGMKIPFINGIIQNNIFICIENYIAKEYLDYEKSLMRSKIFEKNDEKIKKFENIIVNEINNHKIIQEILQSDNNELIDNLFHDALYAFLLRHNIFINIENIIELLTILIKFKLKPIIIEQNSNENLDLDLELTKFIINNNIIDSFEDDNEILKVDEIQHFNFVNIFGKIMNFIESYSKEILYIINIFNSIKDDKLLLNMKKSLNDKEILMDDERNKEPHLKQLKCCFFYIVESLLKNISNYPEPYSIYEKVLIYIPNIIKMEKIFLLFSKEIFILEIIYKIISFYKSSRNNNPKQIQDLINIIINHQNLIKSKNYKGAFNNLIEIKNKLLELNKNSEETINIINEIILNQYKIVNDQKFRKDLIENLLLKENQNEKINLFKFLRELVDKPNNLEVEKVFDKIINANKKNKKTYDDYKINFMKKYQKLVLYYLENIIEKYFKNIKEDKDENKYKNLLEKSSLNYLEKSIDFLYDNNIKDEFNILYSIAYIKRYIINYIDVVFSKNNGYISKSKDINEILLKKNTIKLFILKLYIFKCNNDLTKLWSLDDINTNENAKYISIIFNSDEFNKLISNYESFIPYYYSYPSLQTEESIFYLFNIKNENLFDPIEYKKYLNSIKQDKIIDVLEIDNLYNQLTTDKKKYIYKYDILYTYFSYFLPEFTIMKVEKENNILNNLNLTLEHFCNKENKNNIASEYLINNYDKLNKILKENKYNMKNLEIIFYSYRFYFNILTLITKNTNNFYFSLITKYNETINSSYIPGFYFGNLHNSISNLKSIFTKNNKCIMFICSCGEIYNYNSLDKSIPCYQCLLKKEKKYNIFQNQFYGLIFANDDEKKKFYEKNKDINIESITLKNLEEISKNQKKIKEDFVKRYQDDDISYIRYRLLNFIFYGFIYFLNIFDKIKQEELNNILIDSMSLFDIIQKDWDLLDKELKINNIPNIHIFLDSIFHKIISEMIKIQKIESEKDLKNFEKRIDDIISKEIKDKNLFINYLNKKYKFLDIKSKEYNEELAIISEEYIYNEEWLKNINIQNKYPKFNLFTYIKLPSLEDFENEFNYFIGNKNTFPIINSIINEKNSFIKYLEYIPKLNEFCNYMINYCSYKYTRDQAKKIKIENEIKDKNDLINDIKLIYDELRPFVTQYDTHIFNDKFISLKKENNLCLSDFCLDKIELGYGMILAAIYHKLIEWQNDFIESIKKSKNKIYEDFKDLFNDDIMIQKCSASDIVILPKNNELMEEYILKNAFSNNYRLIKYNFKLIEEELSENILPKIKKFKADKDKCLKYVIYKYESFIGNNDENIITLFNKKYKRRNLSKEELKLISEYVEKSQYKGEKNILDFWNALQILIDVILENNYSNNELIISVIKFNYKNNHLNILKDLFDNNNEGKKLFTIDALMTIYYQFEFFCWEYIKQNLDPKYLIDIENDIKNEINNNIDKNKLKIISRNKLLKAIRRFISRYLLNKRSSNDIYDQNKLIDFLNKRELWDDIDNINKIELEKELKIIFKENIIYVKQALKLYESLGEEEDEDYQEKDNIVSIIYNSIKSFIPNLWYKNKQNDNNIIKENDEINLLDISDNKKRKSIGSNSDEEEDPESSSSRSSLDNESDEEKSRKSLDSKSDNKDKEDKSRPSGESNLNNESEDS